MNETFKKRINRIKVRAYARGVFNKNRLSARPSVIHLSFHFFI